MRTHLRAVPDDARVAASPPRPVRSAALGDTGWTAVDAPSPPGSDSRALDLFLPGGQIVRLRVTPAGPAGSGVVHLTLDAVGPRDELIELVVAPMLSRRRPRV